MSTLLPSLAVYEGLDGEPLLSVVKPLYAEIYAEPPYWEGPQEVQDFAASWPERVTLPGFRLVVAHADGEPIGFSFGHRLPSDTDWWDGLLDPVPKETVQEHDGRTFAVIELAVRRPYRVPEDLAAYCIAHCCADNRSSESPCSLAPRRALRRRRTVLGAIG